MRLRLGDTGVSPICSAAKAKSHPPLQNEGDEWPKCRGYDLSQGTVIERSTLRGDRDVIGQIDARKVRQVAL